MEVGTCRMVVYICYTVAGILYTAYVEHSSMDITEVGAPSIKQVMFHR